MDAPRARRRNLFSISSICKLRLAPPPVWRRKFDLFAIVCDAPRTGACEKKVGVFCLLPRFTKGTLYGNNRRYCRPLPFDCAVRSPERRRPCSRAKTAGVHPT